MQAEYNWAKGSRITSLDATLIGAHLEKLRTANEGELTPAMVLKEARKHNSPLHSAFDWDDTSAAAKFRLSQAGTLIRAVTVTFIDDDEEVNDEPIRAYVSVQGSEGKPVYVSINAALTDADMSRQLLFQALNEIKRWRARHARLKELSNVFAAMDAAALVSLAD